MCVGYGCVLYRPSFKEGLVPCVVRSFGSEQSSVTNYFRNCLNNRGTSQSESHSSKNDPHNHWLIWGYKGLTIVVQQFWSTLYLQRFLWCWLRLSVHIHNSTSTFYSTLLSPSPFLNALILRINGHNEYQNLLLRKCKLWWHQEWSEKEKVLQ